MNSRFNKNTLSIDTIKPWISSVFLLPLIYYLIKNDGRILLIDYLNLLIHEGGHGIFKIFGKFIYSLGGTTAQILIPGMFLLFYLIKRNKIPAQISLIWLGQNLINISIYASDARAQKLPLLGGKKVYHDWTYLLSETGLLNYDQEVGLFFYSFAILAFVFSILLPLLVKNYKPAKINLDL